MTALPLILLGLGIALFMRSCSEPTRMPGEPPWEPERGPELGPSREAGPPAPPREPERASAEDRAIAADELGAMLLLDAPGVEQAIAHIEPQIGIRLEGLRLYVTELGTLLPATRQALSEAVRANPQRMMVASEAFGQGGFRQIAAQLETISRLHASRSFTADLVALVRDVAENGPPGEPGAPPAPPAEPIAPPGAPVAIPTPIVQIPPGIPGPPTAIDASDRVIALDELSAMTSTDLVQIGATIGHLLAAGLTATGLGAWATELGKMRPAQHSAVVATLGTTGSPPYRNLATLMGWTYPQATAQLLTIADLIDAGQWSPDLIARVRRLAEKGTP